ncbi:hypothetical protein SERLA73DRAFT_188401 [Serpula lacrymans var. lacrymans S7.3]|uniref:Protein kinase domain-containing protein n=2 Tax=Serpula lacrymans var. lacrymans TaxID=341189 RepID=F8QB91_SERL3|nr:uncharacterized protein SERLADRAFT_478496 [Serpula lacrymans var. lacrymans S7.9]EGN94477.1 hypothetical protein SERLA73DRAFT_188401 [Serpula lacrymans var. lacrymans S7.3]EGO19956.1 hypothetical protein SERLADRAFT_478496 [Serpula lacrymans var. lacrymans S7.9]
MNYAEGGTLWDVLESSPHDGRVTEADMKWWTPQAVSAIHWCHSKGFVHRDIKPHNFVLTPTGHLLLIDFGSAAPLLPPKADGRQLVPKRYCLVPCGTCDYISPEILQAHEEALVALEMTDGNGEPLTQRGDETEGYGVETDWWSLGAMLYEMAYGVAPFFAKDIRTTYLRIIDHKTSLRFNQAIPLSAQYQAFLRGLLTSQERRLGRHNVMEITEHPFFEETNWSYLEKQVAPSDLHLPHFEYSTPVLQNPHLASPNAETTGDGYSQGFAFSALFQSSVDSSSPLSLLHSVSQKSSHSSLSSETVSAFLGFSWGPSENAFTNISTESKGESPAFAATPHQLRVPSLQSTPYPLLRPPSATPARPYAFATPIRPHNLSPYQTLPRMSTIRRTAERRAVSDREAMKQLVDCIGMSARKKVLESGRKPRILSSYSRNRSVTFRKELQFIVTDKTYDSDITPAMEATASERSEDTESEGPPSPSPSPRPGSAMSMISRRSATPTVSASYSGRFLGPPSATYSHDSRRHYDHSSPRERSFQEVPPSGNDDLLERLEKRRISILLDLDDIGKRLELLRVQIKGGEG